MKNDVGQRVEALNDLSVEDDRLEMLLELYAELLYEDAEARDGDVLLREERLTAPYEGFVTVLGRKPSQPACPQCPGVGRSKGGANRDGTRYCYQCYTCGLSWNQTRATLLSPGQDPQVKLNCKRALISEASVRSNGYACRACGLKKNMNYASSPEMVCACPRKKKRCDLTHDLVTVHAVRIGEASC